MKNNRDHKIGDKIREIRKANKLTLKELGNILSKSTTAMSALENGDTKPTPAVLETMAKMGSITIDELVTGKPCGIICETCTEYGNGTLTNYDKMMLEHFRGIDPKYHLAALENIAAIERQHPLPQQTIKESKAED